MDNAWVPAAATAEITAYGDRLGPRPLLRPTSLFVCRIEGPQQGPRGLDRVPRVVTLWEYAQLVLQRDPGDDVSAIYGFLRRTGDDEWVRLGLVTDTLSVLSGLGQAGWELVGSPVDVNAVFAYQAGNDSMHDRAYFLERGFWFKRQHGADALPPKEG